MHRRLFPALIAAFAVSLPAWAEDPSYSFADERFRLSDPNPASFSFYGSGRLQMPSLRADVGSSLQVDRISRDFGSISTNFNQLITQLNAGNTEISAQADALKLQLGGFLDQFEKGMRTDYEFDTTLLGFAGSPFAAVQINGRPLSLGLHLGAETRGFINAHFSEQFNTSLVTLTAQLPDVFATGSRVTQISSQAGTVINQINQLTQDIDALAAEANAFFQNPSQSSLKQLTDSLGTIDDRVDALLPTARELTDVVGSTSSGARNLLGALKTASGGGIQVTAANDLHLTLGVGASYPVFESEQIKVSLGAQAKLFMLPLNVPVRSLQIDSDASLLGKLELTEVGGITDTSNLEASLDSFDKAVTSVNTSIDSAEKISASVDQVEAALRANDFNRLASSGSELVNNGLEFNQSIGTAQRDMQQAALEINNIQRTLLNQLAGVNAKGTLTTPDGAGFGLDLGIDAVFYRNLRLGLLLQNPLVLWQGTERPFEGRLISGQGSRISFEPSLNIDDSQAKKVNYNATVPLTALLNAQYRFDDLLPNFPGLYGHGQFEYVANGRTPALTIGVQKQWDPIGYAGLSGRLGGISSLLILEAGLRPLQGFGLDFQLGISPLGQGVPFQGFGWLGASRLGLYWQF